MQKVAKFEIRDLLPIGMVLVILGIAISYGLDIMGDTASDICTNDGGYYKAGECWNASTANWQNDSVMGGSSEFNATIDAVTGVAKIPAKLPTIVGVIVIAVILGILVRYLMMRFT